MTPTLEAKHILRLLAAIPSLASLKLGVYHRVHVYDFASAIQQLTSLHFTSLDQQFGLHECVDLLERYPLLTHLVWNDNEVSRDARRSLQLMLGTTILDSATWVRIFAACPGLLKLHFSLTLVRGNETALARIGEAYGTTLETLILCDVISDDLPSIETLLCCCSTLTSIIVEEICCPAILRMVGSVGSNCPLLTRLSLCGITFNFADDDAEEDDVAVEASSLISDADMEQLFINCPKLTKISIIGPANLTSATLVTIIHLKMSFHSLHFGSGTMRYDQSDVQEFKEQLKEHGLVPIPLVSLRIQEA